MTDDDLPTDLERILFGSIADSVARPGGGPVPGLRGEGAARASRLMGVGDPVPMPVSYARPEPEAGFRPGEQSGAMLGVSAAAPPFYASANVFEDAQLDTAQTTGLFPLAPAVSRISAEWWGSYYLNSGVNPFDNGWSFMTRGNALNNTNSGRMRYLLTAGTNPDLEDVMIGPGPTGRVLKPAQRRFPFMVGTVRALHTGHIPDVTSILTLTLELWKNYPGGSIIDSRRLNYVTGGAIAIDGHHLLRVAGAMANWGVADECALVVRMHWAGASTDGDNSLDIAWVEPQLHASWTNEPNPFAPFGRSWPSTTLLRDGHWDFTYNGDGTIATATRSGIAGVATAVITYAPPGRVSSVVTTRNNKVITSIPSYNGLGQIIGLDRTVTPP